MKIPGLKKDRFVGRAEKRRYDLPLAKGEGTRFLVVLIALMTFLAMLAVAAFFALSAMTTRWTSGLENKITIEIPAQDAAGNLQDRKAIFLLTRNVANALHEQPGIEKVHVLSEDEIETLVEPWLGQGILRDDFPLPGIISVETGDMTAQTLQHIHNRITSIAPKARIDTHEEWLKDLLRFTGALQLAAVILVLVIGVTTVTAVAGAIRSRLAIHHAEVELLHLMGASDRYITKQFQRHSLLLALRGGMFGALTGGLALIAIGWVAGEMSVAILPDFRLGPIHMLILATLPFVASLIASSTARITVLNVLAKFP